MLLSGDAVHYATMLAVATTNVVRTRLRVDTDIVDIVLGKGVTFEDPPD